MASNSPPDQNNIFPIGMVKQKFYMGHTSYKSLASTKEPGTRTSLKGIVTSHKSSKFLFVFAFLSLSM